MKTQDIENMQAGRELDELIALKVTREDEWPWHETFDCGYPDCPRCACNCPKYSTNIADAWLVVEKFPGVTIQHNPDTNRWHVYLRKVEGGYADADTAPLAICRAALLAVSQENDTPIGIQMLAAQRKAFDRFDVLPEGE